MTTENPIEALAARAQQLPPDIRWIAGNMQGWIQAAGMSVEPKRGPWELRSWRLMRLAGWLRLERPLSFLVNLLLLAGLYASQFRVRGARPAPSPLFIGIDALREPDMIRRFSASQGGQAVSIDGRGVAGFLPYGRVGILDLCRALLDARRGVWRHLSEWEPLTGIDRLNAINFLMLRGHQYAYFYAWFRQYLGKPGVSPVVAFTAANNPAYAAVAAGAQTVYMLHGFQRHSIVYPDFARCVSITAVEAGHLRRR